MFEIKLDDLTGQDIQNLLQEHIEDMQAVSPPESKHALDLSGLKENSVKFWTVWKNNQLAGCGALKHLDSNLAELKSMRTSKDFKQQGVASFLLKFIINFAKDNGYQQIKLETGSMDYFLPAVHLYQKHQFTICEPFWNYQPDPNSVFMQLNLKNY